MYGIRLRKIKAICIQTGCRLFFHVAFAPKEYANRFWHDEYGIVKEKGAQQEASGHSG
jgi:hypothetical protein